MFFINYFPAGDLCKLPLLPWRRPDPRGLFYFQPCVIPQNVLHHPLSPLPSFHAGIPSFLKALLHFGDLCWGSKPWSPLLSGHEKIQRELAEGYFGIRHSCTSLAGGQGSVNMGWDNGIIPLVSKVWTWS